MNWAAHSRDPRSEVSLVLLLAAQSRDLASPFGLGHDDQALALAEPRGRGALGEPGDPLDHVPLDAALLEPAHGPALHHDVDEVHWLTSSKRGSSAAVTVPATARAQLM